MNRNILEIVKEYLLQLDELDFVIKGRICRLGKEGGEFEYFWDISHHCKPSDDAAGVYYPSRVLVDTFDEAERLLMRYMESFTTFSVTKNKTF